MIETSQPGVYKVPPDDEWESTETWYACVSSWADPVSWLRAPTHDF